MEDKTDLVPVFNVKIINWLLANKLKVSDFCEKNGISCVNYANWLSGKNVPGADNLNKLSKATNGFITSHDFAENSKIDIIKIINNYTKL